MNSLERLAGDVVKVLLVLLHTSDVVGERSGVVTRFGRIESEKLGKGCSVLGILMDTKLDVLGESRVELVELLLIFRDLLEELKDLLDDVLLDDLHDLVLLKSLCKSQ